MMKEKTSYFEIPNSPQLVPQKNQHCLQLHKIIQHSKFCHIDRPSEAHLKNKLRMKNVRNALVLTYNRENRKWMNRVKSKFEFLT